MSEWMCGRKFSNNRVLRCTINTITTRLHVVPSQRTGVHAAGRKCNYLMHRYDFIPVASLTLFPEIHLWGTAVVCRFTQWGCLFFGLMADRLDCFQFQATHRVTVKSYLPWNEVVCWNIQRTLPFSKLYVLFWKQYTLNDINAFRNWIIVCT